MLYHNDNWLRLNPLPVLDTPRLRLRMFTADDLADAVPLYTDPQVCRHLNMVPDADEAAVRTRLDRFVSDYGRGTLHLWAVARQEDNRAMGAIVLKRSAEGWPSANIGYAFARAYWGNGYATEALRAVVDLSFAVVALHRLDIDHFPENTASARVISKNGFYYEGYLHEAAHSKGLIRSLRQYCLLRSEWEILRGLTPPEASPLPIDVRPATPEDTEALADLLSATDESVTAGSVAGGLAVVCRQPDSAVFLAHCGYRAVGVLHVRTDIGLTGALVAEVLTLCARADELRPPVENALLTEAACWAEARGAVRLVARPGEERRETHRQYTALGFESLYKRHLFSKRLDSTNKVAPL